MKTFDEVILTYQEGYPRLAFNQTIWKIFGLKNKLDVIEVKVKATKGKIIIEKEIKHWVFRVIMLVTKNLDIKFLKRAKY